jgi:lysophospholipid acyltransferase (LPLAT)-like uncharacterized protein
VKAFLRSAPVQTVLGFLLGGYLWLVLHTIRWNRINREPPDRELKGSRGVLVAFWHGRIAAAIAARPVTLPHRPARLMISLSPDGEFIAKAMAWQGFPSFRGSSRKTRDPRRKHSGGAAYRQSLEWLRQGGVLILTPDGPRGPAEQMAEGVVRMAVRTGAPLFLMGFAATPALELKTWDRMILPSPFGRGAIVFDGPLFAPPDADEAAIRSLRQDWAARLTAANAAAEAAIR